MALGGRAAEAISFSRVTSGEEPALGFVFVKVLYLMPASFCSVHLTGWDWWKVCAEQMESEPEEIWNEAKALL